jgi:zinc transport system substrate-binding protein
MKELDRVDAEIAETFAAIHNKTFIVFHPAYGYFADDDGLQMYALEEDGKEATPQNLQNMIDLAKAGNIKAIFSQAEIDSKQPGAFAKEIDGEKVILEPLSDNYIANLERMTEAISEVIK